MGRDPCRGKRQRTHSSSNYVWEREGGRADPFHWHSLRTDNFAYIIQVYIMANTSSRGIMIKLLMNITWLKKPITNRLLMTVNSSLSLSLTHYHSSMGRDPCLEAPWCELTFTRSSYQPVLIHRTKHPQSWLNHSSPNLNWSQPPILA